MRSLFDRIGPALISLGLFALGGVAALAVWLADPGRSARASVVQSRGRAARTVVRLVSVRHDRLPDGTLRFAPAAAGSGTIVGPEGTILTSYDNVTDAGSNQPYDLTLVLMSARPTEPPVPICYARPVRALTDRKSGLALVQCEEDLSGRPLGPRADYPWSPLRRTEVREREILVMMGYTVEHGCSLRQEVTRARPSGPGATKDVGVDLPVPAGMSGGAVFDLEGRLAGVPVLTAGSRADASPASGVVRRNSDARKLVGRARASAWSPATWRYRPVSRPSGQPGGRGAAPRIDRPVHPGRGKTSFLAGRLVSSQTGFPVAGGVFVVLRPEARWGTVNNFNFGRNVVTWAVSDAAGYFRTGRPLARGRRYRVGILARGFKPVRVSGLQIPTGAAVVYALGRLRLYPPT